MNVNTICDQCGNKFYRRPSHRAATGRTYCSTKCYGEAKKSPERECRQCRVLFRYKRKEQKFCSVACASKAATKSESKIKHKSQSMVYGPSDEEFSEMVRFSSGITEIAKKLGMSHRGSNRANIKKRIEDLKFDVSHFTRWGADWAKNNPVKRGRPLSEIMVENSTYLSSYWLKKRLLDEGVLENVCEICGQEPEWNGKPLVLILDHINGIRSDNRRENLRTVCPHCDSQLPTYKAKNKGRASQ